LAFSTSSLTKVLIPVLEASEDILPLLSSVLAASLSISILV
jgi:hypothetical protein